MPAQETPKIEYTYQVEQKASANVYFDCDINGEAVRLQLTARHGATPEQLVSTADALIAAYSALREKSPLPSRPVPAAVPHASGTKKPYERKPVPANEVPEDLPSPSEGGTDYFKDEFDYFIVEPKPDEKATVKFYKDKLKYPVGAPINNWKIKSVQEALTRLGEFDLTKPQTVRVAGYQFWTEGNEYTKADGAKGRYKDFRGAYATF